MAKQTDEEIRFRERKRWMFLGLPFTFTVYVLKDDVLTIDAGFFNRVEDDCYMYKIQDVQHVSSLLERMLGLGTVICHTGDTTHPTLKLVHIRHSKQIKNYILEASESARMRRRTLNTLDIGTGSIDVADMDD